MYHVGVGNRERQSQQEPENNQLGEVALLARNIPPFMYPLSYIHDYPLTDIDGVETEMIDNPPRLILESYSRERQQFNTEEIDRFYPYVLLRTGKLPGKLKCFIGYKSDS